MLEKGEAYSYVEHIQSGRRIHIPNTYLRTETECYDYTDYMLPIEKGDRLAIIYKSPQGCVVKKDGVVGWYHGKYENLR